MCILINVYVIVFYDKYVNIIVGFLSVKILSINFICDLKKNW